MIFIENKDIGSSIGYKTKGVVKLYKETNNKNELVEILKYLNNKNIRTIGLGGGSNLLVKGSFDGAFIHYSNDEIEVVKEDNQNVVIKCGSGLSKERLVDYCCEHGYSGLEFWAGIPGLVGGGVAMNCGAYNAETKDVVYKVELCSPSGISTIEAKNMSWAYRSSGIKEGLLISSVYFNLEKKDVNLVSKTSKEYILDRKKKHPLEYPSCGSVFKNPNNCSKGSWELIKDAGLCGHRIGGAMISDKHSNFIINVGNASHEDILKLICKVKTTVKEKFGIELKEEIRIY